MKNQILTLVDFPLRNLNQSLEAPGANPVTGFWMPADV